MLAKLLELILLVKETSTYEMPATIKRLIQDMGKDNIFDYRKEIMKVA